MGEVAKLFVDARLIVMSAFISPYREDRDNVRKLLEEHKFIEVFLNCPISECEKRDPNGIHKKAKTGEIEDSTGINAPYERLKTPEIVLETEKTTVEQCVDILLNYLIETEYVNSHSPILYSLFYIAIC
jgi:adenylylsulfate kinase